MKLSNETKDTLRGWRDIFLIQILFWGMWKLLSFESAAMCFISLAVYFSARKRY